MEDIGSLVLSGIWIINLAVYSNLDIVFFCKTNLDRTVDTVTILSFTLKKGDKMEEELIPRLDTESQFLFPNSLFIANDWEWRHQAE